MSYSGVSQVFNVNEWTKYIKVSLYRNIHKIMYWLVDENVSRDLEDSAFPLGAAV